MKNGFLILFNLRAKIGLEDLNEMNALEDPFCKNWENMLKNRVGDESVNSGWTTLVALIIADMPLELDFVSLASESRTDLWVEKATCKCNIRSNATGCKHVSFDMFDIGFGLDVWQTAMQNSGKCCVLQPLLPRRESCWIRIMTPNMKIVLLKTCIRHTGTYITFSSRQSSGGDSAIYAMLTDLQYLYCNITSVCRRPHNSFMQVGTSMSKFINSYKFLCSCKVNRASYSTNHSAKKTPVVLSKWAMGGSPSRVSALDVVPPRCRLIPAADARVHFRGRHVRDKEGKHRGQEKGI